MTLKPLFAAIGLSIAASSFAATNLGVLDSDGSSFAKAFGRVLGFGSSLGAFTDHYTFTLISPAMATGFAAVSLEWGLDLDLTGISVSGGSLGNTVVTDNTPNSFAFSNLGAGTYNLDIMGVLKGGNTGAAAYSGSISSVASAAPEPAALAMALVGMATVGALVWRAKKS